MDTEISEHGVGAPSTEELDGVGVDAGTEESRGPTRTERTGRDQSWVDAGLVLHLEGSMAESIGDEAGRHVVPLTIVRADMVVERCLGSSVVTLEVKGKAEPIGTYAVLCMDDRRTAEVQAFTEAEPSADAV